MVKVLVIGATGYIGLATCAILRKYNHRVYGLARSSDKAKTLVENEVIAIEGSIEDSSTYVKAVEDYEIDVILDLAGPPATTQKILAALTPVAEARIKKFSHGPDNKIGYVYCSGLWVHGDSVDPISDLNLVGANRAITNPPELVAWRPAVEDAVLDARDLFDVAVVRPGLVYGGTCPIWGISWGPIAAAIKNKSPTATIPLEEDTIAPLIHLDDVAEGFLSVIDHLPIISKVYPVFNLTTSFESVSYINKLAARTLGYTGTLEYKVPEDATGLFPRAFSSTVNATGGRLTSLTGWKPTKVSMLADVDLYINGWNAANN